jgi:hypothetical protein
MYGTRLHAKPVSSGLQAPAENHQPSKSISTCTANKENTGTADSERYV